MKTKVTESRGKKMNTRKIWKKTAIAAAVSGIVAGNTIAYAQEAQEGALEEVIIVGIRGSLEQANALKRSAASIQDSIVAEDIGKFPDQNVAESLQRVTGVSISRTNGVGTAVTVRGFGPKFNIVRINDRTLATTDAGREFDFQVLASELITGADVVKAPLASTPEGSLGAYVNIRTARPLSNPGLKIATSVSARYDDLSEETDPKVSGVFSNSFANDTVGALLAFSFEETTSRIDRHTLNRWGQENQTPSLLDGTIKFENGQDVPDGFAFRRPGRIIFASDTEERERIGINGVLEFAPSPNFVTTVDAMYLDLSRQSLSIGFQIPSQASQYRDVVVDENGTLVTAQIFENNIDGLFREIGQDSETLAFGFNNVWVKGNFQLETDLSYSTAESDPQFNELVPHITADVRTIDMSSYANGTGDVLNFNTTIDVNDPGSIRSHWNDFHHNEIEDEILELKFDGTLELDAGPLKSVQVGISYQDREKSNDKYGMRDDTGCSPCGGTVDLPDSLFVKDGVTNFLDQESGNFPRSFTSITSAEDYVAAVQKVRDEAGFAESPWDMEFYDPAASYANEESTTSVYTQFNLEGGNEGFDWFANVGLRYVETESSSTGFGEVLERVNLSPNFVSAAELRLQGVFGPPQSLKAGTDYSNVLPSFNLTLDFNNGYYVRFGAAKVITKPAIEFVGVNQDTAVAHSTATVTREGGNPFLRPYEATQYDLSFEYYKDSNAYGLTFFHKDIGTFISTITTVRELSGVIIDPELLVYTDRVAEVVNQNENRGGGSITGFEASILHYFDNLPGIWNGLGVQANYTYVNNEDPDAEPIDIPNVTDPGSVLEGLTENSYNLVAFYDKDRVQARLTYNWRDTFLSARQGFISRGWPEYDNEYGQFDFSASYDITDRFTVTGEIINMLDEGRLEFADTRDRITELEYSGRRFTLGLRATF